MVKPTRIARTLSRRDRNAIALIIMDEIRPTLQQFKKLLALAEIIVEQARVRIEADVPNEIPCPQCWTVHDPPLCPPPEFEKR